MNKKNKSYELEKVRLNIIVYNLTFSNFISNKKVKAQNEMQVKRRISQKIHIMVIDKLNIAKYNINSKIKQNNM